MIVLRLPRHHVRGAVISHTAPQADGSRCDLLVADSPADGLLLGNEVLTTHAAKNNIEGRSHCQLKVSLASLRRDIANTSCT